MLGNFSYKNATKLYFGEDALNYLNEELPKYGDNVVLIYGGGSIKKNGIYDAVMSILREKGKNVVEDAGRGYRVVVPSPNPIDIVEGPALRQLVDCGNVVISTGGGGIPVIKNEKGELVGIEAVIDKDLGAAVLAKLTNADLLMILTDVECAYEDFRGPNKRALRHLTVAEAEALAAKGEFAKGSMGPKIQSAIRFVKSSGKQAIITSLDKVEEALADQTGTRITP